MNNCMSESIAKMFDPALVQTLCMSNLAIYVGNLQYTCRVLVAIGRR